MKLIVAGSREGWTEDMIHYLLDESIDASKVTEIVSGGARGVDKYGETWAYENNVEVKLFPANWKEYGKLLATDVIQTWLDMLMLLLRSGTDSLKGLNI